MGAVREVYALFGLQYDPKGEKEAEHGIKNLKEGFEAVAAVFTGSELFRGISEFAEQVGRTGELAEQLHVGTDELQLFQYAAEVSGSSTEELNASLSILQKSLGHAEAATSPQVDALKRLHIQAKDTAGNVRNMSDILPEVFDNFGNLKSEADEAAVATALFGRAGVRLLPTLRNGQEGLKALSAEMGEYGGPISKETIEASKVMADDLKRLDHAWLTFKGSLAGSVLPQVSKAVEWFGKTVAKLGQWTQGTTLANTATYALAGTIAVKLGTALAPYLKSGLKFGAIFLAIDDLIGFLQGKDSLIGRALDAMFGEGTGDKVRKWIIDTIVTPFKELSESGTSVWTGIKEGLEVALIDMGIAVDKFFLKFYEGWNSLVGATGGKLGIAIDTKKATDELAGLQKSKSDLAQKAYDRAHPEEVKQRKADEEREKADRERKQADAAGYGIRTTEFGTAPIAGAKANVEGLAQARFDASQAATAQDPQALFRALRKESQNRAALGLAAAAQVIQIAPASVPGPAVPGGAPSVTIDARTTVTVQGDATKDTAADVARQVSRTAADAHRRAGQSLVQRKGA